MGIVLFPYIPGKCDANPYGVDGSWDITIEHLLISAAEKRFVKFFLGNTAEHAKGKALREDSTRQGIYTPFHQRCSRTDLSRQAGSPVSQNQIRQREQDIQFGNLFSQTSVPGFPVSKLALYYPKDMLYLGPYGRFLLFAAFDLPAGTIVCVFTLRGPPVDFVTDSFPLGIEKNGVFPFFGAQVSTVPIYAILIAG